MVRTGVVRRQVDVQANGTVYGELLKQLEVSKISLRRETPLIQIIDEPRIPLDNDKPGRLKTGIIFSLLGGIACFFYLLLKKLLA